MKKYLFILLIIISGCSVSNKLAQRPFVIVDKVFVYTERKIAEYRFIDSNGNKFMFYDSSDLHQIGDTIR